MHVGFYRDSPHPQISRDSCSSSASLGAGGDSTGGKWGSQGGDEGLEMEQGPPLTAVCPPLSAPAFRVRCRPRFNATQPRHAVNAQGGAAWAGGALAKGGAWRCQKARAATTPWPQAGKGPPTLLPPPQPLPHLPKAHRLPPTLSTPTRDHQGTSGPPSCPPQLHQGSERGCKPRTPQIPPRAPTLSPSQVFPLHQRVLLPPEVLELMGWGTQRGTFRRKRAEESPS